MPADLRAAILPPLKIALADSLHMVFLVAMGITAAGVLVSLLLGDARIEKAPQPALEEAGVTLFAEGLAVEAELAAELVPDLLAARPARIK
jgi:hypothetical protein